MKIKAYTLNIKKPVHMLKIDINIINKIYKTNTVHLSVCLRYLTTTLYMTIEYYKFFSF